MKNSEIIYRAVVIAARVEKLHNLAKETRQNIDSFRMERFFDSITKEEDETLRQAAAILERVYGNTFEIDTRKIVAEVIEAREKIEVKEVKEVNPESSFHVRRYLNRRYGRN
jgi:hypothetical protein